MLRYSNTNNMTDNITDNNTSKNTINNNAMSNTTDNLLTLFCLVDGEWNPFSVEVDRTKTVDMLKDAIKDKNAIAFTDVDAKMHPLACLNPCRAQERTQGNLASGCPIEVEGRAR
ncbi:hypothetical protein BGZ93_002329 [Podila epicladia]|nr:hypothetical protein BGZ93_002329 [Podila epicladia]